MPHAKFSQALIGSSGYTTLRLHSRGAAAWAVISVATGAIATDAENRLLMRLTETEAARISAAMSGHFPGKRFES